MDSATEAAGSGPLKAAGAGAGRALSDRLVLGTAAIVLVIGTLYFWTAATSVPGRDLHLFLAEAFQHGETSLQFDPQPELLALEDPYDPVQNAPYRINDASLYEGKWYLYFGPVPAALLVLPFHVAGVDLEDRVTAPLFAVGAFACAAALLLVLIGRYLPRTPTGWRLAAVAGLGLGNLFLAILRRPDVYETSIAAGQFFLMAAILLLVVGTLRRPPSLVLISLGSLSMGLAVGSRANLALAAPLLVWSWWSVLGPRRRWRRSAAVKTAAAAAGPFVACLLALAVYNVVRFGSPTEFGLSYQLGGLNSRELDFFSLGRLVPGAWFYLVQPPSFGWTFPFITLDPDYPGTLPGDYGVEPVAGLLAVIPIVVFLVAAPAIGWRRRATASREMLILCGLILLVALGVLLLPMLTLPGATERLLADTAGLLIILAAVAWLWLADGMRSRSTRSAVLAVGAAALVYGAAVNLAFGVVGYSDGLRVAHPEIYYRLQHAFSWLSAIGGEDVSDLEIIEVRSMGSNVEVLMWSPGAGLVTIEGDFVPNPALPPRSIVALSVTGSDGVVRRFPLVKVHSVVTAGVQGSGFQRIRINFELVRFGLAEPPPHAPGAGLGLVDARIAGFTAG